MRLPSLAALLNAGGRKTTPPAAGAPSPSSAAAPVAANSNAMPPVALITARTPAASYPVWALGPLQATTQAISHIVQCPDALAAQTVVTAAAFAVQAYANVEMLHGATKPLSVKAVTIAESGERKSSADQLALQAVSAFEEELAEIYAVEKRQFAEAMRLFKEGADASDEPVPPMGPVAVIREGTAEGIFRAVQEGRPSQALFNAEAGLFLGGAGMTQDNRLKMFTMLSDLWDGSPLTRVRGAEPAIKLFGRRLSAHLMCQPGVAGGLVYDPVAKDQGLLARLLMVWPDSNIGSRFFRDALPEATRQMVRFGEDLGHILRRPLPLGSTRSAGLKPRSLSLSGPARTSMIRFHDMVEKELGDGGAYATVRGFGSKAVEHALRLAGVLTLMDDLDAGEISAATAQAAIALTHFYAGEQVRILGASAANPAMAEAQLLLNWLHNSWSEPMISVPDVNQRGPNALREASKIKRAIGILEGHRWLVPVTGSTKIKGVKRENAWTIVRS